MRLQNVLIVALTAAPALATAIPTTAIALYNDARSIVQIDTTPEHELLKRKGGGGSGGGDGGGSGGGDGGGSGGKSGGDGSKNDTPLPSSPNSNTGGRTTTGTGPRPFYGGGRYYGGGSTVPYTSGHESAHSKITPLLATFASLLVFGAIIHAMSVPPWLYPWPQPYTFYNASSALNETKNVLCGCQQFLVCGCDYTDDNAYMDSLIGNGSWEHINKSLVAVAEYEGEPTIFIEGTLPNGTTAAGGAVTGRSAPSIVGMIVVVGAIMWIA